MKIKKQPEEYKSQLEEYKSQLIANLVKVQNQLNTIPKYDWDSMTNLEIEQAIQKNGGCCFVGKDNPVCSLLSNDEQSWDKIIGSLSTLCYEVLSGNKRSAIRIIRNIARKRLEENSHRLYGWFSKKADQLIGSVSYISANTGNRILVTSANKNPINSGVAWDDVRFVGELIPDSCGL